MGCAAASRFLLLALSSICALVAAGVLIAAVFSVSFRYVENVESRGTKYYGLFRFCYEPSEEVKLRDTLHGMEYSCHLRRRAPADAVLTSVDFRQYYADFELASLLLLCCAVGLALLAVCFAVCTLFSELCSLAHCVLLLASGISACAGFIVYTYFNELKDNQTENTNGVLYLFHYGWAYYYSGGAAALLLASFALSLFAAALVLHRQKQRGKQRTISLDALQAGPRSMRECRL